MTKRLLVDHYVSQVASLGSPGVDKVRWRNPVRPGDTLSVYVAVLEAKQSRSKPDCGIIRSYTKALNQDGKLAMTMKDLSLLRRRPQLKPLLAENQEATTRPIVPATRPTRVE